MTIEATYRQKGCQLDYTPVAAMSGGQVIQLADGRAAVVPTDIAAGVQGAVQVEGVYLVQKTANIVILDGGRVYWDHSANAAHYKSANDKDFYLGTAVGDAASAATTMLVALNKRPRYLIDAVRDPFRTVLVLTAGTPTIRRMGGTHGLIFSTTAEAQKIDLLSGAGFAVGANAIVEAIVNVITNSDNAAGDFNVGIANDTHASNADTITESVFVHTDGNSLNLNAESDDGTTEVNATDTTIDFVVGTPFEVWIDTRNPADIQIYINGALVLPDSVFTLAAAAGPMKLLAHLEKSADDSPGEYHIDHLAARIAEQ
jgi:predicted RecA/RadA family phage recombinase